MSWTYRVRKRTLDTGEVEWGIVEAYDDKRWTENCMTPISIDALDDAKAIEELRWQLEGMLKALDKPILEDT
jgi:hypothetical protein